MKKNSPGCTCCTSLVFTLSDAKLTVLAVNYNASRRDLPPWAAAINQTLVGEGEAAEWLAASPMQGLFDSQLSADLYGLFPAGIVNTPNGWMYFYGAQTHVKTEVIPTGNINITLSVDTYSYTLLGVDLKNNEYAAQQTGQAAPAFLRQEGRTGLKQQPSAKVVPTNPGRNAEDAFDVYTHICHADMVLGPSFDVTAGDVVKPADIRQTFPLELGWGSYWNPEYIDWHREKARRTEPAHGVEVYGGSSLVKKYNVPGASFIPRETSRGSPDISTKFAPTGHSVYWIARARLLQWWWADLGHGIPVGGVGLHEDLDYGDLVEESPFPFSDLVDDGEILDASGLTQEGETPGQSQSFEFVLHNDEPLSLLPTTHGIVNYTSRFFNAATWTVEERIESKRGTFVLANACVVYSHSIESVVVAGHFGGNYDEVALAAGMRGLGSLDTVDLDEPELENQTVLYTIAGKGEEWVEMTRIADSPPESICEGPDGAIYVLCGSHVYKVDAASGEATLLKEHWYFKNGSAVYAGQVRNWLALPTNPLQSVETRAAVNPPTTV